MSFKNLYVCHFNILVNFMQISVSLFVFNFFKVETLSFVIVLAHFKAKTKLHLD